MASGDSVDGRSGSVPAASARHGEDWDRLLRKRPAWTPPQGNLLVVAPHPDDEVVGAGGLIRACATSGARVDVLSVSDGEAADSGCAALGNVRREELAAALRKLCPTHVSVTRLALPDGKITLHANRVRNALLSLASSPVMLIGPYELDGHPDHEAVGRLCVEFARARQMPLARYAIRTWDRLAPLSLNGAPWVRFVLGDDARRAKARALDCFNATSCAGRGFDYEPFLL